jgi:hypothetical protein
VIPRAAYGIGLLALAAFASPAGCGSNGGSGAGTDGSFRTCATETRAPPYVPGLARTSASGAVHAVLLSSDPAPPPTGLSSWMVQLADAGGAALDGVAITVTGMMPDHAGHTLGSPAPSVTAAGGGRYAIAGINMFMPGYWEITLALTLPSGATDSVMFPICANQ